MRLICPNCGAQYEVDDQVIPDQGRDVQCSNCGHTWYQRPAHLDQELAEELGEDLDLDPAEDEDADSDADEAEEAEAAPDRERRALDPDVANVLREEAEREVEARERESDGLETQPDLGLDSAADEAAERNAAARARMARLRGQEDGGPEAEAALAAAVASGSRRDLLPDIEEINSSLRASQDREELTDAADGTEAAQIQEAAERRGFRMGFWLVVLLLGLAVLLYVMAPKIIELVPQSETVMITYVDWVNAFRARLNAGVQVVLDWLSGLTGSDGGAG